MSLGQVIEEILPSEWSLSPEAAVIMENMFKDRSLVSKIYNLYIYKIIQTLLFKCFGLSLR